MKILIYPNMEDLFIIKELIMSNKRNLRFISKLWNNNNNIFINLMKRAQIILVCQSIVLKAYRLQNVKLFKKNKLVFSENLTGSVRDRQLRVIELIYEYSENIVG